MSIQHCFNCDKNIDTDYDAEHFDMCKEERDYKFSKDKSNEKKKEIYQLIKKSGYLKVFKWLSKESFNKHPKRGKAIKTIPS